MSNDLRIGLFFGVACVMAVAVLFFQRENPTTTAPPAKIAPAAEPKSPAAASIGAGPLTRPSGINRPLSNPIP